MLKNKIVIGLISHCFEDNNLGCVALSISNMLIIDQAVKELGIEVFYVIMVNEKEKQPKLLYSKAHYEYRIYSSTKKTIRNPIRLLKTKIFDDCDVVFNLCAGDGFTDIYGLGRVFSGSYMTLICSLKKTPLVLAPQTIGPFQNSFSRIYAKYVLSKCSYIFARDHLSYKFCYNMGVAEKCREVIDVAFALPFEKKELNSNLNIGINVSGLLFNDNSNRFSLSFNYRDYIKRIVAHLIETGWNVHLISHVNIMSERGEDDYAACAAIHKDYPESIIVPRFCSPIDAKGYISGLNLFHGARMHATIAAISSGIPTIPFAYSRKVNGLYGNLEYQYYIDGKQKGIDCNVAVSQFKEYTKDISKLKEAVKRCKHIYENELARYKEYIKDIIRNLDTI